MRFRDEPEEGMHGKASNGSEPARESESRPALREDKSQPFNDVRLAMAFATTSRSFALSIGFGT